MAVSQTCTVPSAVAVARCRPSALYATETRKRLYDEEVHLKGAMVTIDAMGCQKTIAQEIIDRTCDGLKAEPSPCLPAIQGAGGRNVERPASAGCMQARF